MLEKLTIRLFAVSAIILAFAFAIHVNAQEPPTPPTPAPVLTHAKFADSPAELGGIVKYTMSVTNSGNADAESSQTLQDTLPAGVDWQLASDTWGCQITYSPVTERYVLSCESSRPLNKRSLAPDGISILDDQIRVSVVGVPTTCGSYLNVGLFNLSIVRVATATVPCPPPPVVETPTLPIPATNTPEPSQPTSTSIPATPSRIAPLPPNTGTGEVSSAPVGLILATSFTLIFISLGVAYYGRRQ